MKKISLILAIGLCSFLLGEAQTQRIKNVRDLDTNKDGIYQEGEVDPGVCYQTGPCRVRCPVVKFRPVYYCEKRCVQEPYQVTKKCCRYVDQYYTKTFCKKVPQYYDVCETKYRTRYVTDKKCRYQPYCTIVEKCMDVDVDCPACPSACPNPQDQHSKTYRNDDTAYNYQSPKNYSEYNKANISRSYNDFRQTNYGMSNEDKNLTRRISRQLSRNSDYDLTEIEIQVKNGTVMIDGFVDSNLTKQQLEDEIEEIEGVDSIENNLQIQNLPKMQNRSYRNNMNDNNHNRYYR